MTKCSFAVPSNAPGQCNRTEDNKKISCMRNTVINFSVFCLKLKLCACVIITDYLLNIE